MALENSAIPKGGNMIEGCSDANELRKGQWTPEEDAILTKFVMENGERNWNDLRRKLGLMRSAQSCRRRWLNNLRSNLKKGDFTPEEERKVLRLHARYGNKWSLIALHLPGRCDNEVKNYWNIRLRRHIRAGLPIYPPQLLQEVQTIHFQQQDQTPHTISSFSSPNPISSSKNEENPNFNFISSSSSSSSSPSSSSNQEIPNFIPTDSNHTLLIASLCHPENIFEFHRQRVSPPSTMTPIDMNQLNDAFLSGNFEIEIPSIQSSSFLETTTPSSPSIVVPSNGGEDNYNMAPKYCSYRNNGLLEDVLRQSEALCNSQLPSNEDGQSEVDQRIMHDDAIATIHNRNNKVNLEPVFGLSCIDGTPMDEWSSTNMGGRSQCQVFEDLSMMDNDLWSWLDFPHAEAANVSNSNIPATTQDNDWLAENVVSHVATIQADTDNDWAQQVMGSPISFTPFEQDHDWALGYLPSFT